MPRDGCRLLLFWCGCKWHMLGCKSVRTMAKGHCLNCAEVVAPLLWELFRISMWIFRGLAVDSRSITLWTSTHTYGHWGWHSVLKALLLTQMFARIICRFYTKRKCVWVCVYVFYWSGECEWPVRVCTENCTHLSLQMGEEVIISLLSVYLFIFFLLASLRYFTTCEKCIVKSYKVQ